MRITHGLCQLSLNGLWRCLNLGWLSNSFWTLVFFFKNRIPVFSNFYRLGSFLAKVEHSKRSELPLLISVFADIMIQKPNETFNRCSSSRVVFSGTLAYGKKWGGNLLTSWAAFYSHLRAFTFLCVTTSNIWVGQTFFFYVSKKHIFSNIYHEAGRLLNYSKLHTSLRKQVSIFLAYKEEWWWYFLCSNTFIDSFMITHLFI